MRETGRYVLISTVGGETCKAFIPDPLPPNPPLSINGELQHMIDRALLSLGRLDSVSTLLPDTSLFLYMYVRKEAVLSSQIEGTQSSLTDLLLFESEEMPGVPMEDIVEVSNYVAALNHGLNRLKEGFPISLRLINEIHKVLLRRGRGSERDPGEFRRTQNWLGGTRPGNAVFIPPPVDKVMDCMGSLEKFLNNEPIKMPILIKTALAHVQFETIHPFLDGNGRIGRLLITLLLYAEGILHDPILYLSLYFKRNREQYYDLLQNVRTNGDWESWLLFFMNGIRETSDKAVDTAKVLLKLFDEDRKKIQGVGKSAGSVLRVHHVLQSYPIISTSKVCRITGLTFPTVASSFRKLIELGIVDELNGKRSSKLFIYRDYIRVLSEGAEA